MNLTFRGRPGPVRRRIGTESAQTRHECTGIVFGEGGGTTPRPYRVGAETASAGFSLAGRITR